VVKQRCSSFLEFAGLVSGGWLLAALLFLCYVLMFLWIVNLSLIIEVFDLEEHEQYATVFFLFIYFLFILI
jgi:hypothetical protein